MTQASLEVKTHMRKFKKWSDEWLKSRTKEQLLKARDFAAGNAAYCYEHPRQNNFLWESRWQRCDKELSAKEPQ